MQKETVDCTTVNIALQSAALSISRLTLVGDPYNILPKNVDVILFIKSLYIAAKGIYRVDVVVYT